MKNIKLWLISLPLISFACSTDNENVSDVENTIVLKTGAIPVANPLNPYDYSGQAFDAVLDLYAVQRPATISGVAAGVDATVASMPEYANYPQGQQLSGYLVQIGSLSSNDGGVINDVLSTSLLDNEARLSFAAFINSLEAFDGSAYEAVYNHVVNYETTVLNNASFSVPERQAILTATSVARYSLYRKKRKDKDWEGSVWDIAAALYGAQENVLFGAKMAAATGLCHNYKIDQ